jgi:hypothetical protein
MGSEGERTMELRMGIKNFIQIDNGGNTIKLGLEKERSHK